MIRLCLISISLLLPVGVTMFQAGTGEGSGKPALDRLLKLQVESNHKDAFEGLRVLALGSDIGPEERARAYSAGVECLKQLNRVDEIDAFREQVVVVGKKEWRTLSAVAQSYLDVPHYGYMIGGEFQRGQHRGGGKLVNANDRDRVLALRYFRQAMQLVEAGERNEAASMLRKFAAGLLGTPAWRLQLLTDFEIVPDYGDGWGRDQGPQGAPVDADDNPVFYELPKDWASAKNDGQRWRHVLETMAEWNPSLRNEERMTRAQFVESQFGVQTLADFGIVLPPIEQAERPAGETGGEAASGENGAAPGKKLTKASGVWAIDTLGEDETIARLATGIKRFALPEDQNYIKLYQQVAEDKSTRTGEAGSEHGLSALEQLAQLFEHRRQYPRAAEYWRQAVERSSGDRRKGCQSRLEQIEGNWGQFELAASQPAGRGATVEFRFRNAKEVAFSAQEINVRQLLDDVKAYLKTKPKQLNWEEMNIADIGYRLVQSKGGKYLGGEVARWKMELEPPAKHFDKRISVSTPLQKAGAYWVTAKVAGGNTSKIILWLSDTAIIRKTMEDKSYYFVADAVSGTPIVKANVEFFAYRQRHLDGNNFRIDLKNFAELTDESGQVFLPVPAKTKDEAPNEYQWLATATTPAEHPGGGNRLAYLGFHNVWRGRYHEAQYNELKTYAITDRPVYRPGQAVEYKFWIAQAQYDAEDKSPFAHQAFVVEIHNPKGEKVFSETLTTDRFGGLAGKYPLPPDATLGAYSIQIVNRGGGSFRVEEYKKPEYEVTIEAPSEPVMLGDKISATIRAKYYFGSPVTQATVKYKVLRSEHNARWYPPGPWDWLYGAGYLWLGDDYPWYPGWREWGCMRPEPPWGWRRPTQPEVVAERETAIGPDGTVKVEIDTAIAKQMHGDQNHRYTIQAEVVDSSRRTIVGSGEVLVARKPFQVFVAIDRGYYRIGDAINASFTARRLDGKPVQGAGKLRLLKITYQANPEHTPEETEVGSWNLATNDLGQSQIQLKASEKGQYRLSYGVTDKAGHEIEGGYVFTIVGEGFDGSEFQFNDLELVPDKSDYAPGETVRLQVNANRAGATVLLFVRPTNGVYQPPQLLKLVGKSAVVDIGITKKDMPNIFVEAMTVTDGRVFTETREIRVPPASRILNMEVQPSAKEFKPGEKAKVTLKLTDEAGKPFLGSTVVSIYDKSLDYISGGSNVGDMKEFFWKWRRDHHPASETNLQRTFGNLSLAGEDGMETIGVFGHLGLVMSSSHSTDRVDRYSYGEVRFAGGRAGANFYSLGATMEGAPVAPAAPMTAEVGDSMHMAAGKMVARNGAPGAGGVGNEGSLAQPTLRSEFADTALWRAALETDKDGLATLEVDMPQNLTAWKIRAWGLGLGTRVGEGAAEAVTRKNIIVRLQAPRFLVERDEVVLSANVHNYLPTAKQVKVRLELDGNTLELPTAAESTVEIPAGGERRVDWRVKAIREGEATVRMLALADEESDAMQVKLPVHVHGMLKMDSFSGVLRTPDLRDEFEIHVPRERRAELTRLEVRYSPTLAGAMVDALPYLIDYPYGCTEQTLNRFVPAVVTQQVLVRMKLDLKAIREHRTNLNAQEIGDPAVRAKGWKRYDRNPVFDDAELRAVVKAGVNRLQEMQLSDGGWGWFSGWGEVSSAHTTATVVHGLQIAKQNEAALIPGVLERGVEWLKRYQAEQLRRLANVDDKGNVINKTKPSKQHADDLDAFVYMVLADADFKSDPMRDRLYQDRGKLGAYSLAMVGLAFHKQDEADKLAMVMRNLSQFVVQDDENQTAYLKLPQNIWWHWYGSEFEAHAYYLKLLAATDPKSEVAPRLVKYLINNRKHASYWNSTRDTALVIEALADYLKATGEDQPNLTIEVWVDGEKRKEAKVSAENLFTFDGTFVLEGDALAPGPHTIELRKSGSGPLYWNAYLSNFTLEDNIRQAGLELKVDRHFYKLTPAEKTIEVAGSSGQAVSQRVEKFERREITDLGTLASGDLVEVELIVESKNDYEYILLEDMKAAGCEPVSVRSGYNGNELGAYLELRDNRVTLFVRNLARGKHSVSYRMRAEIPGQFSALPTKASAMYAPELRANSDEVKLNISDR
ncbi:MAG: alpha-2-macroglobulin [Pirellulales bacterium]|nr:alpha-2-macroglobulin [Pirellulales bacterium]